MDETLFANKKQAAHMSGLQCFSRSAQVEESGHAGILSDIVLVVASSVSLVSAERRKLAHFAAPPLPSETAALGFAGGPGTGRHKKRGTARWVIPLVLSYGISAG